MRQLFLFKFILTCLSLSSQSNDFLLTLTDTTALNLKINLTTDKDIQTCFSRQFYKDPISRTGAYMSLDNLEKNDAMKYFTVYDTKKYFTIYYISLKTVNLTCVTSGIDSTIKYLITIIIDAKTPTRTSLKNFILGKTTAKEVELVSNSDGVWCLLPEFNSSTKYLYLIKNTNSHFYFGIKRKDRLNFEKQKIKRIVISGVY